MPLCEAVVAIAAAISEQCPFLTPEEKCLLYVIQGMTHYREIGRLDAWETACIAVTPPNLKSTDIGQMLDEVMMLGRCNLYQRFQPLRTQEYYARLIPFFATKGVTIASNPDLTQW